MSAATVKKNRESTLKGARWWKEVGWRHIVAILMIIYCLVPLLYVLSVSLNPGDPAVPVPAEVHRLRPDRRRRQGVSAPRPPA